MKPIDWLCAHAPGFKELSNEEREAIVHFSLLWSFFEAETLGTNASANAILALTQNWSSQGQLKLEPFENSLAHFRKRYFENGAPTEHLHGLSLRKNDNPGLVNSMLKGEAMSPSDTVAALLIVVYRLRNNLFHGAKWAYGIRGQLGNFTCANAALMAALEIQGYL